MDASLNFRAIGLSVSARRTVEIAAEAGFDAVDVMVRDLVDSGEDPVAIRDLMQAQGVRGGACPVSFDWRRDNESFRAGIEALPNYAAAASILGLRGMTTWVLPESRPGESAAESLAIQCERLPAIAAILEERGLMLGLEVIGVARFRSGKGTPLFVRLEQLGDLIEELSLLHSNVGLVADAYHLAAAEEPIDRALAWGAKAIVSVHLAEPALDAPADRRLWLDQPRRLPQPQGRADCVGLLLELSRNGYQGPVIAEPMPGCPDLEGLDARASAFALRAALRACRPSGEPALPIADDSDLG